VSAGDLLLEGAGTNLVLRSEEFDNASWFKQRSTISNANVVTAPDGTLSADRLQEDTTATNSHYCRQSFNSVSGTVYTWSCYLKNDNRRYARVQLGDGAVAFGSVFANVDLSLGTITGTGSDTLSSSITPASNGWYRVSVTGEAIASLSYAFAYVFLQNTTSTTTYTGDGTSGIYLWGAQLEQSSYPTSYIPTSGSTATRAADVSTSAATFGNSWYEQSEGTMFADYDGNGNICTAIVENSSNRITLETDRLRIEENGLVQAFYTSNLKGKNAFTLKQNDVALSYNGSIVYTDTSVNIDGIEANLMQIGRYATGFYLNGTISRLTYWPSRLSNDTLQTITT
jgi:hypothetical protein